MEEFMYRVIEMYGDCEPWWFLDGWEEDIVSSRKFERLLPGFLLKYYKQKWLDWMSTFQVIRVGWSHGRSFGIPTSKSGVRTESDDVQFFPLDCSAEDEHKIPKSKLRPGYEKERGSRKHRSCQYTLDSKGGQPCHKRYCGRFFRAI